jgi:rod shape-determining protein MreB
MRHGVIADAHAAEQMIRRFIDMSHTRSRFRRRVEVTLCVPSDATAVERRAVREAAFAAGVSDVALIEEALAAGLGAGLPVTEPVGSMVVDIGAGTTEVAVIALGGIVYREAIRVGGNQFDAAIINYVRNVYGVLLGEQTAERVKQTIGSATSAVPRTSTRAIGRGIGDGLPRSIELSNHDVADALAAPLKQVIGAVKSVLENAPAELVTDIAHRGVVLTGGGALLADLERLLRDETGLVARVADEPRPVPCAARARRWGGSRCARWTDAGRATPATRAHAAPLPHTRCAHPSFWPISVRNTRRAPRVAFRHRSIDAESRRSHHDAGAASRAGFSRPGVGSRVHRARSRPAGARTQQSVRPQIR